jgi:hypothetical protein
MKLMALANFLFARASSPVISTPPPGAPPWLRDPQGRVVLQQKGPPADWVRRVRKGAPQLLDTPAPPPVPTPPAGPEPPATVIRPSATPPTWPQAPAHREEAREQSQPPALPKPARDLPEAAPSKRAGDFAVPDQTVAPRLHPWPAGESPAPPPTRSIRKKDLLSPPPFAGPQGRAGRAEDAGPQPATRARRVSLVVGETRSGKPRPGAAAESQAPRPPVRHALIDAAPPWHDRRPSPYDSGPEPQRRPAAKAPRPPFQLETGQRRHTEPDVAVEPSAARWPDLPPVEPPPSETPQLVEQAMRRQDYLDAEQRRR